MSKIKSIPLQMKKNSKKLASGVKKTKKLKAKLPGKLSKNVKVSKSALKKPKQESDEELEELPDGIDPILDDDDEDFTQEENEFLEKARKGESFPIVSQPLDSEDEDIDEEDGDHGKQLDELMENDPDFYQYLLKNEKSLLDFEDEAADDDEDDSDEYDDQGDQVKVSNKLLQDWSVKLKANPTDKKLIRSLIGIFRRAVDQISGTVNEEEIEPRQKISSENFNEIMKLCFLHLTPSFYRCISLDPPQAVETKKHKKYKSNDNVDVTKCQGWKKVASMIKMYLSSMLRVLDSLSNESLVCSILRHVLQLLPLICGHQLLNKRFLDKITNLWSSESSEKVRILAFLFILRSMKRSDSKMLPLILRKLYLSFVKNSRVTNMETWPFINFMKQSLIELYSLDHTICYQQTFVFVRQVAINLRNAMSNNSGDGFKKVYTWPVVHSLCLWAQMLSTLHPSPVLKPLVYPLVQVMTGLIDLTQSSQFVPLKFHLIRSLILVSKSTDTFIPIAHLIVETLNQVDYSTSGKKGKKKGKKSKAEDEKKKILKKPDLMSSIKVTKGSTSEPNFREEVVKTIATLLLEYLSTQSHKIAFPELTFVSVQKMRKFLKEKCKNGGDSKLLKQILDKIEENNSFIVEKRRNVTFKFSDVEAIKRWEDELKQEADTNCPVNVFYSKWKTIRDKKEQDLVQQKLKIKEEKKLKKLGLGPKDEEMESEIPISDGEDDDDDDDGEYEDDDEDMSEMEDDDPFDDGEDTDDDDEAEIVYDEEEDDED